MLQIRGLFKSYNNTPALRGVDLDVAVGETVVLMGPSGCGKSTLIRCITRLTEPDRGQILFKGEDVMQMGDEALRAYRRRTGFVFQHFNLIARLSLLENVALPLVMAGVPYEKARSDAAAALAKVGLGAHLHDRRPDQLSGGQRQRVGIARALVGQPDLMLWDEPTASLDPILVQEVLEAMEDLARTTQAGMLVVTHEISFALRAADRVVLMDQGMVVENGSPQEVFTTPTSAVGQRYQKLWETRYRADLGTTGGALAGAESFVQNMVAVGS